MIRRLGGILFRLRSWTAIPLLVAFVILARPSAAHVAAALPILALGEALRFAGLRYLDASARGTRLRAEALCTGGPYRFVRHPLYAGTFLHVAGMFVAGGIESLPFVAIAAGCVALQYGAIIASEEAFLAARFPEEFDRYRASVPRLLPCRAPYRAPTPPRRTLREVLRAEYRTLHSLALLMAFVVFKAILLARS